MPLRDRADKARANSYKAVKQLTDLSRKMSELRKESRRQTAELHVAHMKLWIQLAEIRKNALLAGELYASTTTCAQSEKRPFGLPIQ